jgi:hypothetical protein
MGRALTKRATRQINNGSAAFRRGRISDARFGTHTHIWVYTFDMVAHTRTQLEEMVFRAQTLVAEGQERIVAQQARVAALNQNSGPAHESKQFLETMEVTQSLQISHVNLLRRELHEMDWVACPLTRLHDVHG